MAKSSEKGTAKEPVKKSGNAYPSYKQLRYFVDTYARVDVPDHRALWDFVELEPDERLRTFRLELRSASKKNYDEEVMHNIIGKRRLQRFGSYADWAKHLLLVLASKRRA